MLDNMINTIGAMEITEITTQLIKEVLKYVIFNGLISIEKHRIWKIF